MKYLYNLILSVVDTYTYGPFITWDNDFDIRYDIPYFYKINNISCFEKFNRYHNFIFKFHKKLENNYYEFFYIGGNHCSFYSALDVLFKIGNIENIDKYLKYYDHIFPIYSVLQQHYIFKSLCNTGNIRIFRYFVKKGCKINSDKMVVESMCLLHTKLVVYILKNFDINIKMLSYCISYAINTLENVNLAKIFLKHLNNKIENL